MNETLIPVQLDVGNSFDLLSVCNVKINTGDSKTREKNKSNFNRISKDIEAIIGHGKLVEILGSDEYRDLYDCNLHLFNLIDKSKLDTGLAKECDLANYERYLKKAELQKKFFATDLTEVKSGYETQKSLDTGRKFK